MPSKQVAKRRTRKANVYMPPTTPYRLYRKFRYDVTTTRTSTSGSLTHQVWRMNDMYDPDYTSAGHQPRGFDQHMGMYRHFTVIKAFANIKVTPTVVGNDLNMCYLYVNNDTTAATTTTDLQERRDVQMKIIIGSGNLLEAHFKKWINVSKWLNVKNIMDVDELRGASTASPVEQINMLLTCYNGNAGNTTFYISGYIDYYAMLSEPHQPPSS